MTFTFILELLLYPPLSLSLIILQPQVYTKLIDDITYHELVLLQTLGKILLLLLINYLLIIY